MNTTIEAVLYTSKTLSNGQHPIMLRLTKNRKRKYISLHISLALQYWDAEKCKPRRNCPDKERIEALIQQKTQELQSQVMDFKTSDKEYTLNTLVEKASRKVVRQTVGEYLNGYIDRLLAEKRVGNAKTFQELRTSLTKFCRSLDFYFIDIDAEWLKRYEQWLRVERHYSDNSIGIRFRSLRVLYNSAITDGLAHDLAGCLFDKRVQRVFLVAGLKIQNLLLQLFRLGFDKGVYALLVGAIPLGAAFVKVPKFGVERNVQADVLDSAVFREP